MNLLSVHLLLLQLYEIIIVFNNVNIVHTCLFYTYVYGLMRIKIYIYEQKSQFVYLKKNHTKKYNRKIDSLFQRKSRCEDRSNSIMLYYRRRR
jgi:hypothetical protein